MNKTYQQKVCQGQRFQFGEKWKHFLSVLDEKRIIAAENSLKTMLQIENLQKKNF